VLIDKKPPMCEAAKVLTKTVEPRKKEVSTLSICHLCSTNARTLVQPV
jgi:hypothetical protein